MVNATPQQPSATSSNIKDVMSADPDIVMFDTFSQDAEYIANLVLQEIGGIELSLLEHSEGVTGIFADNRVISNLTSVNFELQPSRIGGAESGALGSQYGYSLANFILLDDDGNPTVPVSVDGDNVVVYVKDPPPQASVVVTIESSEKHTVVNLDLW